MPITADAFTIGHDKFLSQLKFQEQKVPMPEVYLATTADAARKILEKINYHIIMKMPHGTHGK